MIAFGLFSVPAPPIRFGERRGFFVTMNSEPWKLAAALATLDWGQKQGIVRLNSAAPAIATARDALEQQILGVRLGSVTPPNAYLRGDDLVATYPPTADRATQIQAYWRVGWCRRFEPGIYGAELVVSAQTDLLGADPKLMVCSSVVGREMLKWNGSSWDSVSANSAHTQANCLLIREPQQSSFVQMVHPLNTQQSRVHVDAGRCQIEHELFESELEKGVILRARIRAAWVPAARDAQVALDVFGDFVASELPLTT